jgi:hypothetical protein
VHWGVHVEHHLTKGDDRQLRAGVGERIDTVDEDPIITADIGVGEIGDLFERLTVAIPIPVAIAISTSSSWHPSTIGPSSNKHPPLKRTRMRQQ